MITEDYVSFETAKLLKEKGFKIPYDSFRGVYINGIFKRLNPGDGYGYNLGDEIVDVCSLQMAMKWLREVHGLHVDIDPLEGNWCTKIVELEDLCEVDRGIALYGTYEEACETAIKYCLEKLI